MSKKCCPFCGKLTTSAAMNCRHCGARLQEILLAAEPVMTAPKKQLFQTSALTLALCCLIAVLSGALCAALTILPNSQPSYVNVTHAMAANSADYRTTATDLYQNYEAYEAGAKLTTGNSAIEISGVVRSSSHNLFGDTDVDLEAGSDSRSVTVTLDGDEGEYPIVGTIVSVRCENMTRILGPPTGQSCRLIP